jgi:hypothetical protein
MNPVYTDVKGRSTRYCALKIGQAQDIDIFAKNSAPFSERPILIAIPIPIQLRWLL